MSSAVEEYRFYSANSDNLGGLPIKLLAVRMANFHKINERDIKFRAKIAGATFK